MKRFAIGLGGTVLCLGMLAVAGTGNTQPPGRPTMEPVAETSLLMQGLAKSNFRGLERNLGKKPADAETWTFMRGQALLLAETGNLLMLRPPRNDGQGEWMDRATEFRASATRLARLAGNRNYEGTRNALAEVAATCNRCHKQFRVAERIRAFENESVGTGE